MAPPNVDADYRKQIDKARKKLEDIISGKKSNASLMLRLALHDAGIYEFTAVNYFIKKGPNGSIGNQVELGDASNQGLKDAVDLCEKVKDECPKITYADLYQLAGVVAVEITKGPRIEFVPGREDSSSTEPPEQGILPNEKLDESQLKKIIQRMGLEEKDIVALFGGLCSWGVRVDQQSGEVPKKDQENFDNSYFIKLKEIKDKDSTQLTEYLRKIKEQHGALLMGKFGEYVNQYAERKGDFFRAYAAAHKKVSELGFTPPAAAAVTEPAPRKPASWNRVTLAGIGIAVATTAVLLGYFLSRRSK